jgi:LmbE family N-acetylglucosaminyl deacetylase
MKEDVVLVIAAHPDDEILGCGATLIKLKKEKRKIYALILGEGMTSRGEEYKEKIKELRDSAKKSSTIIGLDKIYFENLPDNKFDSIPLLDIIKIVERYIYKIKPDIIFTHHKGDLNIDHRLTYQSVLTACRPRADIKHPTIYSFEIPSSTEYNVNGDENIFKPNYFVKISKTDMEKKKLALSEYKTEIRKYPNSRSIKGVEIMAKDWGRKIGTEYAEAFELVREIVEM